MDVRFEAYEGNEWRRFSKVGKRFNSIPSLANTTVNYPLPVARAKV